MACAAIGRLDAVLHSGATPLVHLSAEDLLVAADSLFQAPLAAARSATLAHYDHALEAWVNTHMAALLRLFSAFAMFRPFLSSPASFP
jgi:hypothetical protein